VKSQEKSDVPAGSDSACVPAQSAHEIVYSFDVFDTCISRNWAHPRDLFFALGLKLAPPQFTDHRAREFARKFQARRIRAEKRAYRAARPDECADIHEIYRKFDFFPGLDSGIADLISTELEFEEKSLYTIAPVVSHIEELRKAGHRIIFVSDMYLPADLLGPLLQRLGVMREGDGLYVSCDARLTKHSGNLYRHVLQREGLRPEQLIHTGDNPWADVRKAREAGVTARHFSHGPLTSHETAIAGHRLPRSTGSSFLPALSRRTRLALRQHSEEDREPLEELVCSTIAPFLVAYVDWVLGDARRRGIGRLYFVARDGEVLYRIAKALGSDDQGPELRYLYGSRRAWLSPSIRPDAHGWERLLLTPGQSNSRRDILARAGLDENAQSVIASMFGCDQALWGSPLDLNEATAFLQQVLASPTAAGIIYQAAGDQREIALSYLSQEGLLDGAKWALVDAGWSLNCQAALHRILAARNPSLVPRGYYLALTRDHLSEEEAGPALAFIPEPGSFFSRRRVIIEHCFTPASHATTRGYAMEGTAAVPVFGSELRQNNELAYAQRLQKAASEMARLITRDSAMLAKFRLHRSDILANAQRFLRDPRRRDALEMASFGTVADLRHESAFVQPLCRPLGLRDVAAIVGMTVSRRRNFQTPSYMWLEGSSALSPPYVRAPIKAMLAIDSLRSRLGNLRQ